MFVLCTRVENKMKCERATEAGR